MRILRDFKVPDFKFPKFKMKGLSDIEEMNVDYESLKKDQETKGKKNLKLYEITKYKTVKDIFDSSTTKYAENTFILEKFNIKSKEFLFLDDNVENIDGANKLNIRTIKVEKNMNLYEEVCKFISNVRNCKN